MYGLDNKVVFSVLERARRPFNQLKLMESAILIYRLSRSPEKYVFNVDIGKMSARAGEQKVAQLKKQFGTRKDYDPSTGTIGRGYDPMQMSENFWFVKGSDSQGITVSPLSGTKTFENLDDLTYFKNNLLKALHIPLSRENEGNTTLNIGADNITADEVNFAKFLMSQQKRFAQGLVNGAITHLKYTGIWEAYRLTKKNIKIIINPPVEYETYRRQKLLNTKVTMMKDILGEETVSNLFSQENALQLFMGWNKDRIEENKKQKFVETVENARLAYYKTKIEEGGEIDVKPEDAEGWKSFTDQLKEGLDISFIAPPEGDEDSESGDESDSGDDDFGGGDDDLGGGGGDDELGGDL